MRSFSLPTPYINFRRYKELHVVKQHFGFEGFFTVELVHKSSGLVSRRLDFKNLIVDVGLDGLRDTTFLAGSSSEYGHLAVGTGTSAPDPADTSLGSEVARTSTSPPSTTEGGGSLELGYIYRREQWVFSTSQANTNLTEVGVFRGSSGNNLLCRQLFLDEMGVPTTITKTSDYELRVSYELRMHFIPEAIYNADVNGSPMEITTRLGALGRWTSAGGISSRLGPVGNFPALTGASTTQAIAYSGAIPAAGSTPGSSLGNANALIEAAYTAGDHFRDATFQWLADTGNGSVRTLALSSASTSHSTTSQTQTYYPYNHQFGSAIVKTNTEKLIVNYRRSWGRV